MEQIEAKENLALLDPETRMVMVMPIDAPQRTLRFGVKTTPMHLAYDEILRVWAGDRRTVRTRRCLAV
ncbi:hypothetical protein ABZ468_35470 [Streptomyces sp. NPDC005708]|uniref:hypothetical protein n=1 Tax=Streptomyces sp. NPDC005708 TaxID=3154564 RepID=UPI0033C8C32C